MNVPHSSREQRHELEPLPHPLGAGERHEAVEDGLLLLRGAAGQQLLAAGLDTTTMEELGLQIEYGNQHYYSFREPENTT